MADDFNLYGDLVTSGGDAQVPRSELQAAHARVAQLEAELSARDKKVEKAMKLNTVLVRNLSTIFKTAQVEIARKDAEIARLRDALATATATAARTPPLAAASSASAPPSRAAAAAPTVSARSSSTSSARSASRSRSPSSRSASSSSSSSSSSHRHRTERRRSRSRSR